MLYDAGTVSRNTDIILRTLGVLGSKPGPLLAAIKNTAASREVDVSKPLHWLEKYLPSADESDELFHEFGMVLRNWDRITDAEWAKDTEALSAERRDRIYRKLGLSRQLGAVFNERIPVFVESDTPLVIAEEHTPWYSDERRRKRFYWEGYLRYLRINKRWPTDSLAALDESTDKIVERLSDPCSEAAYQVKGLVVGYVQSGKTANFTGVVAKAADAGYRLIIVLAGTLDILREQTQRRIDKELLGQELVSDDYRHDQEWSDFNIHGDRPSELGSFDWERLTGPEGDYRSLHHAIAALNFRYRDSGKPFYRMENLGFEPVRLVVIKKNPKVISRLATDLGRIRAKLEQVPSLIVDDESDQASINTLNPEKHAVSERTATNRAITGLLKQLPRAQYLGYTATPFANVLINPDDSMDLFPRDFIISLPRPAGYMGVADFYDLNGLPAGYASNEKSFVRDIRGGDEEPGNLQAAIDSFILSGAIKLYRSYKSKAGIRHRHHTMLIHQSVRRSDHAQLAEKVKRLFENGGYQGGKGLKRLETLYGKDYVPVSAVKGIGEPIAKRFAELEPFIGTCLQNIRRNMPVRIVNGDRKDDTPNFESGPVWSILIGGAKLSRGYTVEGLTVSYYRRVSAASDTLMQMGRWFGYRPGYRDLVRLYIGRAEEASASGSPFDIYEAFKAICLDEEEFREEIRKYLDEGLRPIEVPPLVPSHLPALLPTARNKMYNAEITFKNYSEKYVERTVAPTKSSDAVHNEKLALEFLSRLKMQHRSLAGFDTKDHRQEYGAYVGTARTDDVVAFLESYRWENKARVMQHEIEYLKGAKGDPEISSWIVIAPQLKKGLGQWPERKHDSVPSMTVYLRSRIDKRFGVYSEPVHVNTAKYFSGIDVGSMKPTNDMQKFRKNGLAAMLFYPVRDNGDKFITMGFTLQLPKNHIKKKILWTVRRKGEDGKPVPVVVDKV